MHDIHQQQDLEKHTSAPVLYSLPPRSGFALGGTASFKTLNRMLETSALLPRLNWQPARRCASSSIFSTLLCKGALQGCREQRLQRCFHSKQTSARLDQHVTEGQKAAKQSCQPHRFSIAHCFHRSEKARHIIT